jgi:hypothetical protein
VLFWRWSRTILYVFGRGRVLIYQEILPETCESIAAITFERSGNESILIGGDGEVFEYKVREMPTNK